MSEAALIDADRVRVKILAELDRLGVDRPIDPDLFVITSNHDEVTVATPNSVKVCTVPLWEVAGYSNGRLCELLGQAADGVGIERQPWTAIDPPDSNWVTVALEDGMELHFHRSGLVESWPADALIYDEPPSSTEAVLLP